MSIFDNIRSSSYNASCEHTTGLVWNLTSSYTDQSNEASMVSASVIMFILACLFFNLNLFGGLSDVSAILDPKVRLYLSSALSLFLPVMSYLFSEAKNAGLVCSKDSAKRVAAELSLRARLILVWMLLVELLRKKVEVIRMRGMSGTIERAGRVAWLGSLVFFNLKGAGRKALFGILWLLCAVKLVQRIAYTEVGKRSFAYGKNARLITSYMAQMLEKYQQENHDQRDGDELLKRCKYVVMDEEKLVLEASPAGYRLADDTYLRMIQASPAADEFAKDVHAVVTVGKIWEFAERDHWLFTYHDQDRRLRRLCLSFALFKLLRRRFEHLPAMTEMEIRNCRDLIFKGLYNKGANDGAEDKAEALFQVLNDEANFLSEYYHSVVPVVFASPFFLLANYFLLPLIVLVLCLVIIVLCGNGDVLFAFRSMESDNYTISFGVKKMVKCLLSRVLTSPPVFFSTIDFAVTLLLILILVYEEVWEFFVFLLSNWFVVSLLCRYTARPHWRDSRIFSWAIRRILWVRSKMSHPEFSFKQLSVLRFCWLTLMLPASLFLTLPILRTVPVPKEVKRSIAEYLATSLYDRDGNDTALTLSNGRSALAEHRELLLFCESDSVAEVILTWHIATSLLEVKYPPQSNVATSLSKYCAYLVAFHPELLPDNQDSTESVFEAMKDELSHVLGFWGYYLPSLGCSRYDKIMAFAQRLSKAPGMVPTTVVQKGATLGRALVEKASGAEGSEGTWKLLADLWVQLVLYVAPSSDEDCVMGHQKVLAQGGEFITVLWALAAHTGIGREANTPPVAVPIERVQGITSDVCV